LLGIDRIREIRRAGPTLTDLRLSLIKA
jgi:hypothetical protein